MEVTTAAEAQGEIERIRQERATKGGRMSNQEKGRIAELEAAIAEGFDETSEEEEMSEEAPTGMTRIMVTHHNLGVPGPKSALKALQFDILDVPAEFAAMVIERGMARETKDDVNVSFDDKGRRVEVS